MLSYGHQLKSSKSVTLRSMCTKHAGLLYNYIDGEFLQAFSGKTIANVNPATSAVISNVPHSSQEDVSSAVLAARRALHGEWGQTTLEERALWCRKIAQEIRERLPELSLAETRDTGKPITLSETLDIPRAASNFDFFSSAAFGVSSDCYEHDHGFNYTLKRPLGVVGLITPWNLLLYLLTWKVAPALMMGNTIVAKPRSVSYYD